MIFILQNVRSAWNIGQIMRTADALSASIVCYGYTAIPTGHAAKLIAKTALGAEKTVAWKQCKDLSEIEELYPKNVYTHLAIEINRTSKSLFEYIRQTQLHLDTTCIWLGNEIAGIDQGTIEYCDETLHLPMSGSKESLNVSNVATAVGYLLEYGEFCGKIL